VLKQFAEQHQDMSKLVEKESLLVKEIAEVITYEFLLIQTANSVNLSALTIFVTSWYFYVFKLKDKDVSQ